LSIKSSFHILRLILNRIFSLTVKTYKEGMVIKSISKLEFLSNIRIGLNPCRIKGEAFIPLMRLLRDNRSYNSYVAP
jgi:hypothetical protein